MVIFKLRPYQKACVDQTILHFKNSKEPALIVLPTGAGKSIVIAELARIAKGRVLVLAHVKELVEQNHAKFVTLSDSTGIYSAGLNRKDFDQKVIFGSIQSVANAEVDFFKNFSLLIIDECHRVSFNGDTQYLHVISKLKESNPCLCILGLTATPYRLGLGWIYDYHVEKKILRSKSKNGRFFKRCLFELSLGFMIKNKFLTPPVKIDSPVACYDFSSLKLKSSSGTFVLSEIESILKDQKRITPSIIQNIVDMSKDRLGVMIFTTTVAHAEEILKLLPKFISAMVVGETESSDRDEIIQLFKEKKLKFLVNVSVLTTGFDAPHVDVIAILRPTESVSLYQQIVGRGLRLSPGKSDCLILDYTGQGHNLFSPEIDQDKPVSSAVVVEVICPKCGLINDFWGLKDDEGIVVEHYGRKCQGAFEDLDNHEFVECGYLFRFKRCDQCYAENDIAAHKCHECSHLLVDNDKKLKEAMALKDAHVMRVETMTFEQVLDKKKNPRLEVRYYDCDAENLTEYFYLNTPEDWKAFYFNFIRMHDRIPDKKRVFGNIDQVILEQKIFRMPMYLIARKNKHFWEIREKIF